MPTLSIWKVGDCGLQTYQTVTKLKRATALEFAAISPILYIHCWAFVFYIANFFCFSNNSIPGTSAYLSFNLLRKLNSLLSDESTSWENKQI